MQYLPHEYQTYCSEFIKRKKVAAVFLDCGLGKTVITLTALMDLLFDSFEVHKVLVIAPLRVAVNSWPDEIEKWDHLQDLRFSVVVGTEKERQAALRKKADVYIINRENVQWLINASHYAFDFDMIVIDELSSFKSHRSKRFKSLLQVRPAVKRIVGLTGTPTSNGLIDLWAPYRILDKGERLGRFVTKYRKRYFYEIKGGSNIVYGYQPLPDAEEEIYKAISDITISMRCTDYLDMPKCVLTSKPVYMNAAEYSLYDELKDEFVLFEGMDKFEVTAANAGVLAGKLCQMANGAVYTDGGKRVFIHDRKLDALEDLIEEQNGKPVLVAYWFQHDLERITARLKECGIPFEMLKSQESIRRWNNGEIQVALIHPASAGHGLNLQKGGSSLIWFGLTWSLELYQQTNARLWRQGQQSDTVVIHHIITAGTIDMDILRALQGKERTQAALIAAVKANLEVEP